MPWRRIRQVDRVRQHSEAFDRILEKIKHKLQQGPALESTDRRSPFSDAAFEAISTGQPGAEPPERLGALEAIVLATMRPSYLILGDQIEIDGEYDHAGIVRHRKAELEAVARSIGRIDLLNHSRLKCAGTG